MLREILLIILTILAYSVLVSPVLKSMTADIKSLKLKNTISECSNQILRKENLNLKQRVRRLERRMQYANECNDNSNNMYNNRSTIHNR